MAAYHDWDGVPTHANADLLTRILREDLGFTGMVTSDGFGVPQLHSLHGVATDPIDASRQAFKAGIDCEVPTPGGSAALADEVDAGRLDAAVVDRACRNVLAAKERLGLLRDQQYAPRTEFAREEHAALSRRVAERSIVLLENPRNALPLDLDSIATVVVAGPNAAHAHLGGYTDPGAVGVSVLDGIKDLFDSAEVVYAEGCRITEKPAGPHTWWEDEVTLADPDEDNERIETAVASARAADVAIVVVGGNEGTHREGWWFDHLGDRADLTPAGRQEELIERIAATGVTTIAVVISGGPVDLRRIAAAADAVVWSCYLGQAAGRAIADVITGACEPTGRLPITFPRSSGQIPIYSATRPSAGRGYFHESAEPLYRFGSGLTYTTFEIGDVHISRTSISCAEIESGATIEVSAVVTNTGDRAGIELVRVEIDDEVSSVTLPRHSTQGFALIALGPGRSTRARIELSRRAFRLLNRELEWVVEPGHFGIRLTTSTGHIPTQGVTVEN